MPTSPTSKKTVKKVVPAAVAKKAEAKKVSSFLDPAKASKAAGTGEKKVSPSTNSSKAKTTKDSAAAKNAPSRKITVGEKTVDVKTPVKEMADVSDTKDATLSISMEPEKRSSNVLAMAMEKKFKESYLGAGVPADNSPGTGTAGPSLVPFNGEFRGDFTRSTFDPVNHFSAVLMQQGRVQLDADWNEQADIVLHYLRSLARDLIGPYGGPADDAGFAIGVDSATGLPTIGSGHYYVDGILCENESTCPFFSQPDYPLSQEEQAGILKSAEGTPVLAYLDVWERHITFINHPLIREIALGGPDTATRSRIVWQVKALPIPINNTQKQNLIKLFASDPSGACQKVCAVIANYMHPGFFRNGACPQLKARAVIPADPSLVCVVQPDARYRGAENQLYRVEIHTPGALKDKPSFKWSRDNSTVVFPIVSMSEKAATLANLGRDDRSTLQAGDWVELLDDEYALKQKAGHLLQIGSVDRSELTVTFSTDTPSPVVLAANNGAVLRRWDQRQDLLAGKRKLSGGAIPVEEGDKADDVTWIELEDGVQVQFQPGGYYNTGDYWLIPARTVSGDIEWPGGKNPSALPPHGIVHHYAPLALVYGGKQCDCRCKFPRPCHAVAVTPAGALQVGITVKAPYNNGIYLLSLREKLFPVMVTVTDASNKPVGGATVLLQATGGKLSGTTATTNAKGEVKDSSGNDILLDPQDTVDISIKLVATATKAGYTKGSATISLKTYIPAQ